MTHNNLHNQLITAGLHYLSRDFSIVPVTGKHPSFSWKEYQSRLPTQEEFLSWFTQYPDTTGIALVTGPISKVVVLDVEQGEDITDLQLPATPSTATGGGGYHFFFKYPLTNISNTVRVQGRKIDIRGKGGLIVLPPSLHPSGNHYKELIPLTQESLAELPQSVLDLITQGNTTHQITNTQGAIPKGERNDRLARILGKMLKNFPVNQWDTQVLPKLQEVNRTRCIPPLDEAEVFSIFESITKRALDDTNTSGGSAVMNYLMQTLASTLHLVVDQNQDVFLFEKDSLELITGRTATRKIKLAVFDAMNKTVNDEQIRNFTDLLTAKVLSDPSKRFISAVRVSGSVTKKIVYDLANSDGNCVVIIPGCYSVEKNTQPTFRRYKQHLAQVKPLAQGDTRRLDLLLDYIPNLKSEEDKKLMKWYIVSLFVPGAAHPMLLLRGDQGAGKSTLCKLINQLVDPSKTPLLTFPRNDSDLALILDRNWLVGFDNLDHLPQWASDNLCTAITGGSIQTRELYTNNEVIIRNIQNPIMMNGIDIANMKSDLLDRSIIVELERIPPHQRMTEKDYYQFLENDKPTILAAIFTTIAKAMEIFPQISLKESPRMADFAHLFVAIAIATGSTEQEALQILQQNSNRQYDVVIGDSPLAQRVIELIEVNSGFEGSPTDLLGQIHKLAGEEGKKELPQRANGLSRKLNKLKATLADYGITVVIGKDQFGIKGRYIKIHKTESNSAKSSSQLSHDENVRRVAAELSVDVVTTTKNNIVVEQKGIDATDKGCYDNVDKTTDFLAPDSENKGAASTND